MYIVRLVIGCPGPIRVFSRFLNRSVGTGRREEVERAHVDRRHSSGLLRHQQRQEERVEDRAGAVAERVELDRSARRLPQLAGELRDQPRAAVRVGGLLGALLHLRPHLLAAVAGRLFNREVRRRPALAPLRNRRADDVAGRFP